MGKTVTIQVPTTTGRMSATGKVAWLKVGVTRHKFLLQNATYGSEVFLTHYASGMKLTSLTPIKLANMRSYASMPDREAALLTLEKLVRLNGADNINKKLAKAKVLNH